MFFADEDDPADQALRCLRRAYSAVEEPPQRFSALLDRLRDAAADLRQPAMGEQD